MIGNTPKILQRQTCEALRLVLNSDTSPYGFPRPQSRPEPRRISRTRSTPHPLCSTHSKTKSKGLCTSRSFVQSHLTAPVNCVREEKRAEARSHKTSGTADLAPFLFAHLNDLETQVLNFTAFTSASSPVRWEHTSPCIVVSSFERLSIR